MPNDYSCSPIVDYCFASATHIYPESHAHHRGGRLSSPEALRNIVPANLSQALRVYVCVA